MVVLSPWETKWKTQLTARPWGLPNQWDLMESSKSYKKALRKEDVYSPTEPTGVCTFSLTVLSWLVFCCKYSFSCLCTGHPLSEYFYMSHWEGRSCISLNSVVPSALPIWMAMFPAVLLSLVSYGSSLSLHATCFPAMPLVSALQAGFRDGSKIPTCAEIQWTSHSFLLVIIQSSFCKAACFVFEVHLAQAKPFSQCPTEAHKEEKCQEFESNPLAEALFHMFNARVCSAGTVTLTNLYWWLQSAYTCSAGSSTAQYPQLSRCQKAVLT